MDSDAEHNIIAHLIDTHSTKFTRCGYGLYFYDTKEHDNTKVALFVTHHREGK